MLHIITGLATGGAERALYNILAGGLADRFNTAVLSLREAGTFGSHIQDLGVPVYTLNMNSGIPGAKAIVQLRQCVQSFKPDVIQGWMYHGNLAASLARRLAPGKPVLAWNIRHSLYGLKGEKPMTRQVIRANRWLSKSVDALLYNSQLSCQQHEIFGFCSEQGQVIPNGFDCEVWRPAREGEDAVHLKEDIPPDATVIGHVARYHPMKDHARFIRAAVRVATSRDDVHVVLIGRDVNEDNEVLSSLVPAGLKSRFHWLGERHGVPALLRTMDIFCQSSWSEAFPNVLGEAMASGVPCVATDVGDSALIVGDTGEIVTPENDDALFSGLVAMLKKSPMERETMGQAARRRIEANFSLEAVVEQYGHLYQRLVREKGK